MIHQQDNHLDSKFPRILHKVAFAHQGLHVGGSGGPWPIYFSEIILLPLRLSCKFASHTFKILLVPTLPETCISFSNTFIGLLILVVYHQVTMLKPCHKFRSSHQRCSVKKGILKNFANFTGKHFCRCLFLITVRHPQHLAWWCDWSFFRGVIHEKAIGVMVWKWYMTCRPLFILFFFIWVNHERWKSKKG